MMSFIAGILLKWHADELEVLEGEIHRADVIEAIAALLGIVVIAQGGGGEEDVAGLVGRQRRVVQAQQRGKRNLVVAFAVGGMAKNGRPVNHMGHDVLLLLTAVIAVYNGVAAEQLDVQGVVDRIVCEGFKRAAANVEINLTGRGKIGNIPEGLAQLGGEGMIHTVNAKDEYIVSIDLPELVIRLEKGGQGRISVVGMLGGRVLIRKCGIDQSKVFPRIAGRGGFQTHFLIETLLQQTCVGLAFSVHMFDEGAAGFAQVQVAALGAGGIEARLLVDGKDLLMGSCKDVLHAVRIDVAVAE